MVKLICLDMDGTLLDSNREISAENRLAIDRARAKGIYVTLATGRMYVSALAYAKELDIDIPIIAMNGALIKHPVTEAKLRELNIRRDRLETVIKVLGARDLRPNFYNEFTLYVGDGLERYQRMLANTTADPRYQYKIIDSDYTYDDLIREAGHTIQKGILFPAVAEVEEIKRALKEIEGVSVVSSSPGNIEVTHGDADKGSAIRLLGESLGIAPAEIMAIGDSENDKSMLEVAGYPIIMGNAAEALKAGKGFITQDNNNDGVALAIRKYALGDLC